MQTIHTMWTQVIASLHRRVCRAMIGFDLDGLNQNPGKTLCRHCGDFYVARAYMAGSLRLLIPMAAGPAHTV